MEDKAARWRIIVQKFFRAKGRKEARESGTKKLKSCQIAFFQKKFVCLKNSPINLPPLEAAAPHFSALIIKTKTLPDLG